MSAALVHQTVLLREAVEALAVKPSGFYVDGTFGRGGHARDRRRGLGLRLAGCGRLLRHSRCGDQRQRGDGCEMKGGARHGG